MIKLFLLDAFEARLEVRVNLNDEKDEIEKRL